MINRQPHKMSCGPVAVYNALEWSGFDTSYEEVFELFREIGKDPLSGSWQYHLSVVLRNQGIEHYGMYAPTFKDIEDILKAGDSIIFSYSWEDGNRIGAHFVFIDKMTDKMLRVWNSSPVNKTPWITKKRLKKLLKFTAKSKNELLDPVDYHQMFVIKAPK